MSSPAASSRVMNPFHRQEILVKRLLCTQQHNQQLHRQQQQEHDSLNNNHNKQSRKRQLSPEHVSSSDAAIDRKYFQQYGAENNEIITTNEAWHEVSLLLPLLTYGEESNDLLSALLGLPINSNDCSVIGVGNAIRNVVKREKVHYCQICNKETGNSTTTSSQQLINDDDNTMIQTLLSDTVQHILLMKKNSQNETAVQPKEKRLKKQKSTLSSTTNNANGKDHLFKLLPWNVLLRIVIRLTSHTSKLMATLTKRGATTDYCSCHTKTPEKMNKHDEDNNDDDDADQKRGSITDTKSSTILHPLLQALDIILSEIQVSMRVLVSNSSTASSSTSSPPVTKEEHHDKKKNYTKEDTRKSMNIPQDQFLYNWKSHCTNETTATTTSLTSSYYWGPSRYEFLKDVESITLMLHREGHVMGINITEWSERINSIIDLLDEQYGVDSKQQHQQLYSPLKSKSASNVDGNSTSSSPLASITRDHVKRILHSAEVDNNVTKRGRTLFQLKHDRKPSPLSKSSSLSLSSTGEKEQPSSSSSFTRKNLQQVFKSEKSNDSMIIEGETNELEDAYRMSIAFSSLDTNNEEVRGTIERRLSILIHVLSKKNNNNNNNKKVQLEGSESYLESLLSTLTDPSDPSVWERLLKESEGKESPIMLRRGRAVLISFLAVLMSPGWKECINQLRFSPVPSHLGYLSHDGEGGHLSSSEETLRSSFLLPFLEKDAVLLPAPIVTEVGLSVCIRNTLEGNDMSASKSPIKAPGVGLFRNFAPYPASNRDDDIMDSITSPLPNTMELTRDLFDLILRLAADDDSQHQKKAFPLRLVTPSAAESLDIVLQVASDFSDWLCPHSVADRYRFILGQVCQSFQQEDLKVFHAETSESWYTRASSLLRLVKLPNIRARIALYTTQFIILLCGKGGKYKQKSSRNSSKQPHFYALLQQKQLSKFWAEIDGAASGVTSRSIIGKVFDLTLCQEYILPLAFRCSLFLSDRSNCFSKTHSVVGQDSLSLVTILTSVFSLLAEEDLLHECTHVGWAVEMLSFSFRYFLFGEEHGLKTNCHAEKYCPQILDSTCMWEQAAAQMDKIYRAVWGRSLKKLNSEGQWQTLDTTKNYLAFGNIRSNHAEERMILIPSFNVLVGALIKYTSSVSLLDDDVADYWCKFVSNIMFDRYIQALSSVQGAEKMKSDSFDKTVRSLWIRYLAATLQQMVMEETSTTVNERSTEQILDDLITPLLRRLHIKVMKRALRYDMFETGNEKEQPDHRLPPELVATVFTDLFKQESHHFLTKPSPSKTRKWDVYRQSTEKVFLLTPPSTFFAHPSQPGLGDYSSDALVELWKVYGQHSLNQSTLIMVAAGLHVNASATHLMPNQKCNLQDKELLKQRYKSFSSCVKQCIISSFECLNTKAKNTSPEGDSIKKFDLLARCVKRDLSFHGDAEIGLTWWNEISTDLYTLLEESVDQKARISDDNRPRSRRHGDIASAFSTLENHLSAISQQST